MTTTTVDGVIGLAGLFLGVYLTLYHYGFIGVLACNVGSCERVQTSKWSTLLGLPVAAWGAAYYALMIVLASGGNAAGLRELARLLAGWMAVLSVWGVLFTAVAHVTRGVRHPRLVRVVSRLGGDRRGAVPALHIRVASRPRRY